MRRQPPERRRLSNRYESADSFGTPSFSGVRTSSYAPRVLEEDGADANNTLYYLTRGYRSGAGGEYTGTN